MQITMQQLVAEGRSRIREINVAELDQHRASDTVLIDVREPDEFAAGHIPGSLNIPRGVLEAEVSPVPEMGGETAAVLADKDRPLCLYCRTGGRSALAADVLQKMGFSGVVSLAGGYAAWCQQR